MKRISVIILFLIGMVQFGMAEATKAEADKAYQGNQYAQAAEMYEAILTSQGESVEVYYNLGNSYYKLKNMAKAILCYERALLLDPGNSDVRFNLELARSKTTDKVTPISEVFIVSWVKGLINLRSEAQWAKFAVVTFLLFLMGLGLYIFGNKLVLRKVGFIGALVCLILTFLTNWFAYEQKNRLLNCKEAIVMSPTITVKSTPSESGTGLFVLHEGTKVLIEDNSMKGWKEVCLEDGKKGWLPASSIEQI